MIGVATSRNCELAAGEMGITLMRGEKVGFVCRYTNHNSPSKNLTPGEILALHDAGLTIVNVWENGYPTTVEYFTVEKGREDGKRAFDMALDLGQPEGTAIYFAVDFDAYQAHERAAILEYFRGIWHAKLQWHVDRIDVDGHGYGVGVYGGRYVLEWLRSGIQSCEDGEVYPDTTGAYLAHYFWQAYAPGWSGHENGRVEHWANLHGLGPKHTVGGVDCDLLEALTEDFGGW